jgi:tetratricopeptide (TPR) repeat protein
MKKIAMAAAMFALSAGTAFASGYSELNLGIEYRFHDDWDAVIQHLTLALAAPDLPASYRPLAYVNRGDAYLMKRQFDSAVADYTAALGADPAYLLAYKDRGIAYMAQNKFDPAIADFSAIIARRPTLAAAYATRGAVYLQQNRYDLAIADFSTVIQFTPDSASGYLLRGSARRLADQDDAAIDDIGKAIDIDGNLARAYFERGSAYRDAGNYVEAERDFAKGFAIEPASSSGRMDFGLIQWEAGHYDGSVKTFAQVAQADSKDAYAVLWSAISQASAGARDDAGLHRAAAALDSGKWPYPVVSFYLGVSVPDAVFKAAQNSDAEKQKEQVCEANFYIGEWQLLAGNKPAALPMLQAAQVACPHEFIERIAAIAQLKRLQ